MITLLQIYWWVCRWKNFENWSIWRTYGQEYKTLYACACDYWYLLAWWQNPLKFIRFTVISGKNLQQHNQCETQISRYCSIQCHMYTVYYNATQQECPSAQQASRYQPKQLHSCHNWWPFLSQFRIITIVSSATTTSQSSIPPCITAMVTPSVLHSRVGKHRAGSSWVYDSKCPAPTRLWTRMFKGRVFMHLYVLLKNIAYTIMVLYMGINPIFSSLPASM